MQRIIGFLALLMLSYPGYADITMTISFEDHIDHVEEKTILYLTPVMMRSEYEIEDISFIHIMRTDKDMIWMLRQDTQQYAEIPMGQMRDMEQEARDYEAASRAMLEHYMEGMSAEEKARYREYMAIDELHELELEYVKKGSDQVGKWPCTLYEGVWEGVVYEQLCTVALDQLDLNKEDFTMFQTLYAQHEESSAHSWDWEKMEKIGFPVRTIEFEQGRAIATTRFLDISRQAIPASVFEIPQGYRKTTILELYAE